jgi:hypothetical protein
LGWKKKLTALARLLLPKKEILQLEKQEKTLYLQGKKKTWQ